MFAEPPPPRSFVRGGRADFNTYCELADAEKVVIANADHDVFGDGTVHRRSCHRH
jgi:hypothetical protein